MAFFSTENLLRNRAALRHFCQLAVATAGEENQVPKLLLAGMDGIRRPLYQGLMGTR